MEEHTFLCHKCGKFFYKLSTFESHSKWKHMDKTNAFMCDQCGRTFQKKYNLLKHLESGIHDVSETVKCALCEYRALNRKLMGQHYQNFHAIALKESNIYFKTADEFYLWKSEFENKTKSRFVKMSSSRKRKNGYMRSTYFCHRDGNFIPKGRNIRHLKVKGSNKINAHCPAKMEVDIGETVVIVSYISTHLGHEMDITRMSLDRADKALIAKKLALKVPFEQILNDINNSKEKDKDLQRVNLLTRKDLWNIVDTFKINPKSVVYSKTRIKRKKDTVRCKVEQKKKCVFYKVFNQNSNNSSDQTQVIENADAEQYSGQQVISVKQENEKSVIFCPVFLKRVGGNEYVQEYALISSDESEGLEGTCFVINSQGELESVSGHQVVYTQDGDIKVCETLAEEDELDVNEQSVVLVDETNGDLTEVSMLNEMDVSENSSNEVVMLRGVGSEIEQKPEFEIPVVQIRETENSDSRVVTCVSDTNKIVVEENKFVEISNYTDYSLVERNTNTVQVKNEMDECTNILYIDNCSNEDNDQSSGSIIKENSIENNSEYQVTIADFKEEGVNEYVIISTTEEELDECTVISQESNAESSESILVKEEVVGEAVIKEEVVDNFVVNEEECAVVEPEWSKKRTNVLHKLLNVHNMINNEQQLSFFSKNISSLENVIKALSQNNQSAP